MRESDLYIPVRDWLRARGYVVHVEIFDADIVAMKDGKITVVELKLCLTGDLYVQCCARARWADFVFAAIGSNPRTVGGYRQLGFGVLIVQGSRVRQKAMARQQPWHWHKARAYREKKLLSRTPAQDHEVAGIKSSQALREQRAHRLAQEDRT